ncbi:hypothetical protein [Syntrophomonas zehnderi]|nr:hypothetical protein [Syntrophomonas zehnderi]
MVRTQPLKKIAVPYYELAKLDLPAEAKAFATAIGLKHRGYLS